MNYSHIPNYHSTSISERDEVLEFSYQNSESIPFRTVEITGIEICHNTPKLPEIEIDHDFNDVTKVFNKNLEYKRIVTIIVMCFSFLILMIDFARLLHSIVVSTQLQNEVEDMVAQTWDYSNFYHPSYILVNVLILIGAFAVLYHKTAKKTPSHRTLIDTFNGMMLTLSLNYYYAIRIIFSYETITGAITIALIATYADETDGYFDFDAILITVASQCLQFLVVTGVYIRYFVCM